MPAFMANQPTTQSGLMEVVAREEEEDHKINYGKIIGTHGDGLEDFFVGFATLPPSES